MFGENTSIVKLPLTSCLLLDMPDGGLDCSIYDTNQCVRCPLYSQFATGEGNNDYGGFSHIICFIIGVIVILVGSFGAIANLLIIIVLQRQKSRRGFNAMLSVLAVFDMICSGTSTIAAISAIAYYQNFNRGIVTLYMFWLGTQTAIFAKSGSSFQTVLITFERYLCVAFPMSTSRWFTPKRSYILSVGIFFFSFFLAFPRYSSHYVGENINGEGIASTKGLDYLIMSTRLEKFWYGTMRRFFDYIDFYVPLPVLLVLNGLIYVNIMRFTARRMELNMKQKKDIRAVKMFLPVVIVLFLCNIIPIIDNISLGFYQILHKEVYMLLLLSYVANSAANLPIYYYRGSGFRQETRALLSSAFPKMAKYFSSVYDEKGGKGTTTGGQSGNTRSNDVVETDEELEKL